MNYYTYEELELMSKDGLIKTIGELQNELAKCEQKLNQEAK